MSSIHGGVSFIPSLACLWIPRWLLAVIMTLCFLIHIQWEIVFILVVPGRMLRMSKRNCNRGERLNLALLKQKVGELFICWDELLERHCRKLVGDRDWEIGTLFWWLHFKEMAPRLVRKTFLSCRRFTSWRSRERIYSGKSFKAKKREEKAKQKQKQQTKNPKKTRRKNSKKRRSGAWSHEACLKFSEAEGTVKAVLVKRCSDWTNWGHRPTLSHSLPVGLP